MATSVHFSDLYNPANNVSNVVTVARFLTPLIFGIIMSTSCPMSKESGSAIPARPPGYVFGIVWFCLYILLGTSWALTGKSTNHITGDILFSLNVVLMLLWVIVYSCMNNTKGALFVLLALVMSSIALLGCTSGISTILIAPYIGWIIFALMLNFTEVNLNMSKHL